MSQQSRLQVRGVDGTGVLQLSELAETEAARKRAIRARCLALRPAKMGARDIRYVEAHYLPLPDVVAHASRDLVEVQELTQTGRLPLASYTHPDGTGMFPLDHLALWADAGDIVELPKQFHARYHAAAKVRRVALADDEAEQAWIDYLTGMYGVCLKTVTPETILEKGIQSARIEALLGDLRPDDRRWIAALRTAVNSLDDLERPFTGFDRRRFGHPTSRDRLITAVRRDYPRITA